jgi:hypothetical protein
LHGTTALPAEGVASTFSQNLAKKTVTAIKRWREGTEEKHGIQYRNNQLKQDDPVAHAALLASIEKNNNRVNLEAGEQNFAGNQIIFENDDREWVE